MKWRQSRKKKRNKRGASTQFGALSLALVGTAEQKQKQCPHFLAAVSRCRAQEAAPPKSDTKDAGLEGNDFLGRGGNGFLVKKKNERKNKTHRKHWLPGTAAAAAVGDNKSSSREKELNTQISATVFRPRLREKMKDYERKRVRGTLKTPANVQNEINSSSSTADGFHVIGVISTREREGKLILSNELK